MCLPFSILRQWLYNLNLAIAILSEMFCTDVRSFSKPISVVGVVLMNVSIGFTRESNRCIVVGICFLKSMPNLVFIASSALKPRSPRSARSVLKMMERVMANPKYLYSFVISNFVSPNQNVLLKDARFY